jgi:glycosyltransferase involved in cell wall biosynthesis
MTDRLRHYLTQRVTVVIPVYNRAGIVCRAIVSALEQSIPPFEVLVVDDGSTDDTVATVTALTDPRVRCIPLGVNRGAQYARLLGIREARGEYLVFLDSDDELLPDSVEKRLRALAESGWSEALVYGDAIVNGKVLPFERLRGPNYSYLLKELSLCPYSVMLIPRSCFVTAGLPDEDFPSWQDDDMVLTIGRHFPVLHCGVSVALIHAEGDGISYNSAKVLEGCSRMVGKYGPEILKVHGRFRLLCWRLRVDRYATVDKWRNTRLSLQSRPNFADICRLLLLTARLGVLKIVLKPFFGHQFL